MKSSQRTAPSITEYLEILGWSLARASLFTEFTRSVSGILESTTSDAEQIREIRRYCNHLASEVARTPLLDSAAVGTVESADRNRLLCQIAVKSLQAVQIRPGNSHDSQAVERVMRAVAAILEPIRGIALDPEKPARKAARHVT